MTDWHVQKRVRAQEIVAMLVPLLQAESPSLRESSSLSHLHLLLAAVDQSVLGSCIQFFLVALSGTPGNASDCDKRLDCSLFELSGMYLSLNVFIS